MRWLICLILFYFIPDSYGELCAPFHRARCCDPQVKMSHTIIDRLAYLLDENLHTGRQCKVQDPGHLQEWGGMSSCGVQMHEATDGEELSVDKARVWHVQGWSRIFKSYLFYELIYKDARCTPAAVTWAHPFLKKIMFLESKLLLPTVSVQVRKMFRKSICGTSCSTLIVFLCRNVPGDYCQCYTNEWRGSPLSILDFLQTADVPDPWQLRWPWGCECKEWQRRLPTR